MKSKLGLLIIATIHTFTTIDNICIMRCSCRRECISKSNHWVFDVWIIQIISNVTVGRWTRTSEKKEVCYIELTSFSTEVFS